MLRHWTAPTQLGPGSRSNFNSQKITREMRGNVSGHFQLQAGTLGPAKAPLGENNPSARGRLSFQQLPRELPDPETRTSTAKPALQVTALRTGQAGALQHPDTDRRSRDRSTPRMERSAASSRRPPRGGQEHPLEGLGARRLHHHPVHRTANISRTSPLRQGCRSALQTQRIDRA